MAIGANNIYIIEKLMVELIFLYIYLGHLGGSEKESQRYLFQQKVL